MSKKHVWLRILGKSLSYILVAAVASVMTLALWEGKTFKLVELENIVDHKFIGQADLEAAKDAAAEAFVNALGDRWSYYVPAKEYTAYLENKANAYVGIGITIEKRNDGTGFDILEVAPGGSAQQEGILPGDILVEVEGESVAALDTDGVRERIQGKEGTTVFLAILRNTEKKTFTLERRKIKVAVATSQMLLDNIGLVRIVNFNTNCAKETIAEIEKLLQQGATALIFDVRNNPGGYVREMIQVLDYLLPEGVLYRDMDYRGFAGAEYSDAACVKLPMAVLVNGNSYSAAEFFAAVLEEYDWAIIVGEQTCGKGYYQNTLKLSDGSAVNLSTGKYFTPSGVNLTEVGGLTPAVVVEVDKNTAAMIYAQLLPAAQDPQIQAAVQVFAENNG